MSLYYRAHSAQLCSAGLVHVAVIIDNVAARDLLKLPELRDFERSGEAQRCGNKVLLYLIIEHTLLPAKNHFFLDIFHRWEVEHIVLGHA